MTKKLIRLLGPALFIFILSQIDLSGTAEILSATDLRFLLAALLLYPCLIFLKAWRWNKLLGQQDVNYGLAPAFLAYNSSLGVGYVTPGRLGEFVKALYLRQDEGISLGQGLSSVLVDRLFDLYLLLMTAGLGIAFFSLPSQLSAISAGVLSLAGLAPLLLVIPGTRRRLATLLVKGSTWAGASQYQEEIKQSADQFQQGMEQLLNRHILLPLLVTAVAYALFYLQCYLIALALRLPLSYPYTAFCVSLASLLALMPISVSGLGVRDASFIALLLPLGITAEMAVSYSLLILLVFNVFGGLWGGVCWIAKPLR